MDYRLNQEDECRDCRFWTVLTDGARVGLCAQLCTVRMDNGDRLLLSGQGGALTAPLWTDMEFGCTQFEARTDEVKADPEGE